MHDRIEKPLKESIKCESSSPAGSFILVESIRETGGYTCIEYHSKFNLARAEDESENRNDATPKIRIQRGRHLASVGHARQSRTAEMKALSIIIDIG